MDDNDTVPRQAPPPKPTQCELSVAKPSVPEVSLLVDSDDSLMWQQPRHNNNVSKDRDIPSNISTPREINCNNINKQSQILEASREKESLNLSPEVFRDSSQSLILSKYILHKSEKMPKNGVDAIYRQTPPHLSQQVQEVPLPRTAVIHNSGKCYDPQLYSPSQKTTGILSKRSPSVYQAEYPLVSSKEIHVLHTSPDQHIGNMTSMQSQTRQLPNSVGQHILHKESRAAPNVNKVVHFEEKTAVSTLERNPLKKYIAAQRYSDPQLSRNKVIHDRPKSPLSWQQSPPVVNQSEVAQPVLQNNFPHYATPPNQTHSSASTVQNPCYHTPVMPSQYNRKHYSHSSPQFYEGRTYGSPDPMIYKLMEDQNQQIADLHKAIERLTTNQQQWHLATSKESEERANDFSSSRNASGAQNVMMKKDAVSQTDAITDLPKMVNVATNTDFSWSDLISSLKEEYEATNSAAGNNIDTVIRTVTAKRIERKYSSSRGSPRPVKEIATTNSYTPDRMNVFSTKKNITQLKQTPTQRKEVSVTVKDMVFTTVHEESLDQESSMHEENMLAYQEEANVQDCIRRNDRIENEENRNYSNSPVFGESPSMSDGSCCVHPQQQTVNQPPIAEASGAIFLNNVVANIQEILQTSQPAEEELEDQRLELHENHTTQNDEVAGDDACRNAVDPKVEAHQKQLKGFDISFLDPVSPASHKPVVDSMCLPGIQNMLSICKSRYGVFDENNSEVDAVLARNLTDSQLATIAAMSPAMAKRKGERTTNTLQDPGSQRKFLSQNKRLVRVEPHQGDSVQESYSIATKQFLDKYTCT